MAQFQALPSLSQFMKSYITVQSKNFHCDLDLTSDGEELYCSKSAWQEENIPHFSDNSRPKQEVPDE